MDALLGSPGLRHQEDGEHRDGTVKRSPSAIQVMHALHTKVSLQGTDVAGSCKSALMNRPAGGQSYGGNKTSQAIQI